MPHYRRRNHAGPNGERVRRLISSEKLNARPNARRSSRRGRIAKTTPLASSAVSLARCGSGPRRNIVSSTSRLDKGLWGPIVQERLASIRCQGVRSAMNGDFGDKRAVVERYSSPDKAGTLLRERELGVDTRGDRQDVGVVVRRCVRNTVRKLQRRT